MIVIEKAILHILDFNSGMTVYSDVELEPTDSIQTFLLKHLERSWGSQDAKPGTFYEDSAFKKQLAAYVGGELSFVDFSKQIGKTLEDAYVHAEEMVSLMSSWPMCASTMFASSSSSRATAISATRIR